MLSTLTENNINILLLMSMSAAPSILYEMFLVLCSNSVEIFCAWKFGVTFMLRLSFIVFHAIFAVHRCCYDASLFLYIFCCCCFQTSMCVFGDVVYTVVARRSHACYPAVDILHRYFHFHCYERGAAFVCSAKLHTYIDLEEKKVVYTMKSRSWWCCVATDSKSKLLTHLNLKWALFNLK